MTSLPAGPGAADTADLITRSPQRLTPDPSRVIAKLFVPGEEVPEHDSRTALVIGRVLALEDEQVDAALSTTRGKCPGPSAPSCTPRTDPGS